MRWSRPGPAAPLVEFRFLKTAAYEHSHLSPVPSSTGTRLTSLTRRGEPPGVWAPHLLRAQQSGDRWVVDASVRQRTRPGVARLRPLPRRTSDPHGKMDPGLGSGARIVELAVGTQHAIRPEHDLLSDGSRTLSRLAASCTCSSRLRELSVVRGGFAEATRVLENALAEIPQNETEPRDQVLVAILNTARYDPKARINYRNHISEARDRVASEVTPVPG